LAAINYQINPILENKLTEEEKWDLRRKQGLPVPGIDIKLCDPDTGEEVPRDGKSVGEVCLRGPWITVAYHKPKTLKAASGMGIGEAVMLVPLTRMVI
jgi:fatty-acyl-CoA synthase